MAEPRVLAYLGPSMPTADARRILDADYRPPIRRGDLTEVLPGTFVALIDGVFEQNLAVSPREVLEAVRRGVVIFGGASMGALRAAEVPGVIGVGRVFEWYRDEIITRDDEVALLFLEHSGQAVTVPTVNVRFAAERLVSLGTIDKTTGDALVEAALRIPYKERTYRAVLQTAGMLERQDAADLIEMLKAHDLKYRDAQAVLETVDRHVRNPQQTRSCGAIAPADLYTPRAANGHLDQSKALEAVLIWESGDRATPDQLFEFLVFTGKLEKYARASALDFLIQTNSAEAAEGDAHTAQMLFNTAARRWGWLSAEEARVTLLDLGLDLQDLSEHCVKESTFTAQVRSLVRKGGSTFRRSLWAELFLNDLALKRETMRLGSMHAFACQVREDPTPEELREAQNVLCKVNGEFTFDDLRSRWAELGCANEAAQATFVQQLARARRGARELIPAAAAAPRAIDPADVAAVPRFLLQACPKPGGESRFCSTLALAEERARRLSKVIGITRIGMIGELGELGGIQIAQAARPGNAWSSSYGSGKALSRAGAVIGSVMEETEKWAQEQFNPDHGAVLGSFAELHECGRFIDPGLLDLPFDSIYNQDLVLHWHPCFDLLTKQELYVPLDALRMRQGKHDIYFTHRGARKHLATNGLGAGFSREEAVLHGICEYVERHAQRLAELFLANPGGLGSHPYRFIDLSTASSSVQELAQRLARRGAIVRVLDITSEVAVPTFLASVIRDQQKADGYGAHPNPNIAIEMALLEAAQTIASSVAGAREDLSIKARSLGRHERPRPISVNDAWFWQDPDPDYKSLHRVSGLISRDVYDDIIWCLERIRISGVKHALVVDLTLPEIEPANVVRIILPGLETNNPFYTGPRARLLLLRDLLPKLEQTDISHEDRL